MFHSANKNNESFFGLDISVQSLRLVQLKYHSDKTRKIGPLKQADDAMYFDTTGLSIDEVVNKMVSVIKQS